MKRDVCLFPCVVANVANYDFCLLSSPRLHYSIECCTQVHKICVYLFMMNKTILYSAAFCFVIFLFVLSAVCNIFDIL